MPSLVKDMMLNEIRKHFENIPYTFISSFSGIPVADISELRRSLQRFTKRSLVVKHSFAVKIFSEMKVEDAKRFLKDNVLVTLTDKEPQAVSKMILEFSKNNKNFVPKGVIFDHVVYDQQFISRLSKLPSRKELLTLVAVRIQSPILGFVLTLNQLMRGLVVVLNEVRKKRESTPA
ncbi:MAG: 50S ribosomal protein L10 [Candidatus Omnitrophica bacterium]|nr:50S ribosomal protein L10 [Candidatus Omnitrophota bacterium]